MYGIAAALIICVMSYLIQYNTERNPVSIKELPPLATLATAI